MRFSAPAALIRAAHELIDHYDGAEHAADDALWAVNRRFGTIVRYRYLDMTNWELGHQAVLELFDEALAFAVFRIFYPEPYRLRSREVPR